MTIGSNMEDKMNLGKLLDEALVVEKKKETNPSLKPPKEWIKKMKKELKSQDKYKDFDDEKLNKVMGGIWYNNYSKKAKKNVREDEGKKYGKAKKNEAIEDTKE